MTVAATAQPIEEDNTGRGFVTIVGQDIHRGKITLKDIEKHTHDFSRPALFKGLVNIDPKFSTRQFYEQVGSKMTLQWRVKTSDKAVSMRDIDGESDY